MSITKKVTPEEAAAEDSKLESAVQMDSTPGLKKMDKQPGKVKPEQVIPLSDEDFKDF
jgi:hypothetical protein